MLGVKEQLHKPVEYSHASTLKHAHGLEQAQHANHAQTHTLAIHHLSNGANVLKDAAI